MPEEKKTVKAVKPKTTTKKAGFKKTVSVKSPEAEELVVSDAPVTVEESSLSPAPDPEMPAEKSAKPRAPLTKSESALEKKDSAVIEPKSIPKKKKREKVDPKTRQGNRRRG